MMGKKNAGLYSIHLINKKSSRLFLLLQLKKIMQNLICHLEWIFMIYSKYRVMLKLAG